MISHKKYWFSKLVLSVVSLAICSATLSQQTAHDLVGRMLDVSMSLNYSGVFSYESVGAKRNVKVSHQVLDGHAYERISYLDGVVKDRLRKSLVDNCTFSSSREIKLQEHYQFNVLGEYRVAGRQAYKIQVMPLDKLRYGYQFGVDQQSGLMLQSTLFNQSGQPLEKFKYVDIQLEPSPGDLTEIRFFNKFKQVKTETCVEDEQQQSTRLIPLKWVAKWVPPGFFRSSQRFIDENKVSLFYTDGISVFSVLIDDSPEESDYGRLSARVGPTQMMTANYRHNGRDFRITVSGQMPQSTVNRIVLSVRPLAFSQIKSEGSTG